GYIHGFTPPRGCMSVAVHCSGTGETPCPGDKYHWGRLCTRTCLISAPGPQETLGFPSSEDGGREGLVQSPASRTPARHNGGLGFKTAFFHGGTTPLCQFSIWRA